MMRCLLLLSDFYFYLFGGFFASLLSNHSAKLSLTEAKTHSFTVEWSYSLMKTHDRGQDSEHWYQLDVKFTCWQLATQRRQ